ncbi:hypothetical protein AB2B41_07115 [Marimonas sp. MJW-29]|uniref:Uncharacterized protein n=1 Tax=Sulfitobacter sediminis TaxID=3234186 RepID=A0ABV3RL90_9RHOB
MPRPLLPKAKEITDIARSLRAEGFNAICIETDPDGRVSIIIGESGVQGSVTPLEKWKTSRGAA